MNQQPIDEYTQGDYEISTDKHKLDLDVIHSYLTRSYWSPGIPKDQVAKAIEHSLCFGLHYIPTNTAHSQVGFARAVTDYTTFAYLADVFVLPSFQGRGLGKWMMECVVNSPTIDGIRTFLLLTRDAHGLYAQSGFIQLPNPDLIMGKHNEVSWYNPELVAWPPNEN
ncbi:MAG: GNAT family N-acetyltransferase [Chloroflexota bacterium]